MRPPIAVDPVLAADAYLAGLPKAGQMLAAARTHSEHCREAFNWAWTGLALLMILKSRLLTRLRDRLAARRTSPALASLLCIAAFVASLGGLRVVGVVASAALWPDGQGLGARGPAGLMGLPNAVALCGLTLWGLVIFRGRAPRRGWVWLSAIASGLIFAAILIPPVTLSPQQRQDQLTADPKAQPILSFVRQGGLPARNLFVFPSKDPAAVDMEGLGSSVHAAVSAAALVAPTAQTYAAIGHLLGHYRHRDLWWMALLVSAATTGMLYALWRPPSSADVAALPAMGLIIWAGCLVAAPTFNLFDQTINYRADDYALSLTRDPDGLCQWLVVTAAQDKPDPAPLESLLFYDHPPLKARLINAMRWKAAHGG